MTVAEPKVAQGEFNSLVGCKLAEWAVDYACVELVMDARHTNSHGIAHGGVLATVLDYACGMAGCFRPEPELHCKCMTLSLTTNFIAPMRPGLLKARARRTGGGKSVFFTEGQITNESGNLIATASGTFRLIKPKTAK